MTDSWIDRKNICAMNMCVHSSGGFSFYNSIKDLSFLTRGSSFSNELIDASRRLGHSLLFRWSHNNSANMTAKGLLKEKRPSIF